jgi:hypothetical protein
MKKPKKVIKDKVTKIQLTQTMSNTEKLNRPNLKLSKIALVSRNYLKPNKNSDFESDFEEILKFCDNLKCDSIIFSLFSIKEKNKPQIRRSLEKLKFVKSLFLEEYINRNEIGTFITYYRENNTWCEYLLTQKFGSLSETNKKKMSSFLNEVENQRILGNFTVLLCGESNLVKFNGKEKKVEDTYGYFDVLPKSVEIILNPIHDKMMRYEMNLKRKFLSKNDRTVISIWNKGKIFKDGKTRDGSLPAWKIYKNEEEIIVHSEKSNILNNSKSEIEIGILNLE